MANLTFSQFKMSSRVETIGFFTEVFANAEGENEGQVIGDLVADILDTTNASDFVGYQARLNEELVGCILLTRLIIDDAANALLLSPVAVKTRHQRQGVGQRLVRFGLDQEITKGHSTVFTYGDPNYYGKFGFTTMSEDMVRAPHPLSHPHGWLGRLDPNSDHVFSQSQSRCIPAFDQSAYW